MKVINGLIRFAKAWFEQAVKQKNSAVERVAKEAPKETLKRLIMQSDDMEAKRIMAEIYKQRFK